jgi:hypothetical protein
MAENGKGRGAACADFSNRIGASTVRTLVLGSGLRRAIPLADLVEGPAGTGVSARTLRPSGQRIWRARPDPGLSAKALHIGEMLAWSVSQKIG